MSLPELVNLFFNALQLLLLIYILGSWLPGLRRNSFFRALDDLFDPLLAPFRRILPPERLGGLDISPIFFILVLGLVRNLLMSLLMPRY
jgi:YggT family protein